MSSRQLYQQLEPVAHIPGQAAAIRFFDPDSSDDLLAMREILKGKQVKKWMDNTQQLSQADYRDWAGTETAASFLFATLDARSSSLEEGQFVRGFVYIYSEREEKFRVKRMEKQGFLESVTGIRHALEVSFAVRPLSDGVQLGSGLMSSALRQSCLQVEKLLTSSDQPEITIFAFIDPENLAAQRTVEAAGFTLRGPMHYDWDSEDESNLYILDWPLLHHKVEERSLEAVQVKSMSGV